ncbi:YdcF family protein [Kistimonas scapharcae]|uniref:YdcF family protein n=1 Tax=Kistimonas scapharcae TaxID=1036133 RepID=A0ABP8V5U5_9GAMM
MMKTLLLPPGLQIVLLILALILWGRYRMLSWTFVLIAVGSLYLLSVRPVADRLVGWLEMQQPTLDTRVFQQQASPEAIVVLGSGINGYTPDYDMLPQPSALLFQRLRYAARIADQTGLPILVSGGAANGINESAVMSRVLLEDFGVTTRWQENQSMTTMDNGRLSKAVLSQSNISNIILVTHALHMPRAAKVFRHQGFKVVTAPTAYLRTVQKYDWRDCLPMAAELRKSQLALHEMAGLLWYRIRYEI